MTHCNLATCSAALPQCLKLMECFLHVSLVTHKETKKHVVSLLKNVNQTKGLPPDLSWCVSGVRSFFECVTVDVHSENNSALLWN